MRYMQWKPQFESGSREATLEVFDIIRSAGGFVDAIYNTPEQDIVCAISDDVDLSILDEKWQAKEISEKRLVSLLKKNRDPQVFLTPDGMPVFPTEILQHEILTVPVEYI